MMWERARDGVRFDVVFVMQSSPGHWQARGRLMRSKMNSSDLKEVSKHVVTHKEAFVMQSSPGQARG
jgi:hypothetical protein